jgi:hypothetical protein
MLTKFKFQQTENFKLFLKMDVPLSSVAFCTLA